MFDHAPIRRELLTFALVVFGFGAAIFISGEVQNLRWLDVAVGLAPVFAIPFILGMLIMRVRRIPTRL